MEANTLARETNARLVDRYVKRRDGDAFAELVRRFGPMVLGIARRLLSSRDDADDATQIVFAELARRAGTIEDPALVGAWLHTIAVRVAGRMRARRPNTEPLVADPVDPRLDLVDVGRRSDLEILSEELDQLPAAWREPLLMRYFAGVSNADAAAQLGTTQKAYEGRLKRGRNSLRVRLLRRGVGSATVLGLLGPAAVEADTSHWDAVTDAAADLATDPSALTFVPTESATLSTPLLSTKGFAMTGAAVVVLALFSGRGEDSVGPSPASPISTLAADEPESATPRIRVDRARSATVADREDASGTATVTWPDMPVRAVRFITNGEAPAAYWKRFVDGANALAQPPDGGAFEFVGVDDVGRPTFRVPEAEFGKFLLNQYYARAARIRHAAERGKDTRRWEEASLYAADWNIPSELADVVDKTGRATPDWVEAALFGTAAHDALSGESAKRSDSLIAEETSADSVHVDVFGIGVHLADADPAGIPDEFRGGLAIAEVVADGPADRGGLQVGDVLLTAGGIGFQNCDAENVSLWLDGLEIVEPMKSAGDDTISARVLRNGQEASFDLPLSSKEAAGWRMMTAELADGFRKELAKMIEAGHAPDNALASIADHWTAYRTVELPVDDADTLFGLIAKPGQTPQDQWQALVADANETLFERHGTAVHFVEIDDGGNVVVQIPSDLPGGELLLVRLAYERMLKPIEDMVGMFRGMTSEEILAYERELYDSVDSQSAGELPQEVPAWVKELFERPAGELATQTQAEPSVSEREDATTPKKAGEDTAENLAMVYELADLRDADDEPIHVLRDIRALAENPPTSIEKSRRDGGGGSWTVLGSRESHRAIEALIEHVRRYRLDDLDETEERLNGNRASPIDSGQTTKVVEPHPFDDLPVYWNGLDNQAFGTISLGHLTRGHQPLPPNFRERLEARVRAADQPVDVEIAVHDTPSTWTWYGVSLRESASDSEEVPSIHQITQAVGGILHREAVSILAEHRQLANTDTVRDRLHQVGVASLEGSPIPLNQAIPGGSTANEWESFDDLVRPAQGVSRSQLGEDATPNGLSTATTILQHYEYPGDSDDIGFLAKKDVWKGFVDRVNNTHLNPNGTAITLLNVSSDGTATLEIPKSPPGLSLLILKRLDDMLPGDFFGANPAAKAKLEQSYRDMLSNAVQEHGDAVPQWLRQAIDDSDAKASSENSGDGSADSMQGENETLLISQHGFELLIDPDDVEGSWREVIKEINERLFQRHGESVEFKGIDDGDVELAVSDGSIGLDTLVVRELLTRRASVSREQTELFEDYLHDSLKSIGDEERDDLPAWVNDELAKPIDAGALARDPGAKGVAELAADAMELTVDGQKVLVTTDADGKLSIRVQQVPVDKKSEAKPAP